MLKSEIEKILKKEIESVEELKGIETKFHTIESEIDAMANKKKKDENNNDIPYYDLNKIIQRAKELIVRVFDAFQGNSLWINNKWSDVERKIRKNLEDLE